ncbi:MAG: Rne/Rng family ribonuclease [Flavobacteriales bacterium]
MNELIINSSPSEVVIAILKDKKLVELHRESRDIKFAVGDIYLGTVRKVVPGLNAAFVDVGYEKDAFLHYFDLGPQVRSLNKYLARVREGKENTSNLMYFKNEPEIEKSGSINDVVKTGQQVLVQVAKEPISTKGPRIGSEISIPGRYLVLVPFSDRVSVSQKIRDGKERDRLRQIIQNIKPKNFGVIIRTNSADKPAADLEKDLADVLERWKQVHDNLVNAKPNDRILGELSRTSAILRDVLNSSFNSIHVDDEYVYEEVREYLMDKSPENVDIVKLYKDRLPIFEHTGIARQIKTSFGKTVTLKSGIYLIIEHTEAMHVIDINSGHRSKTEMNQEENALAVNLEAAAEVARQLRLRDMGGIIVIDFIDMKNPNNRKQLFNALRDGMKEDRAKHSILPPSKFGVIEITRQRVRPATAVVTNEVCPTCKGTGEVQPSIVMMDKIEADIKYIFQDLKKEKVIVTAHPFVAAYLTKGFWNPVRKQLGKKYGGKVEVQSFDAYDLIEMRYLDKDGVEIELN